MDIDPKFRLILQMNLDLNDNNMARDALQLLLAGPIRFRSIR